MDKVMMYMLILTVSLVCVLCNGPRFVNFRRHDCRTGRI